MKKLTKEEWLKRAKEIYGDKYDYSLFTEDTEDTKIQNVIMLIEENIMVRA